MSQEGPRLRAEEEHVAENPLARSRGLARHKASTAADADTSPHAHKFRSAVAVLFALGLASLVAAFLLSALSGGRTQSAGDWSTFQPQDGGLQGAQEIADYVSPYYRATPAYQLAVVSPMNLSDPNNPIQLAIPSQSSSSGFAVLPTSSTVAYQLCGLGSHDCSIGIGTPSANRLLLLRREALELALYTFKYIGGVHTVVAILPPGKATTSGHLSRTPPTGSRVSSNNTSSVDLAVAFDRKELQPWLDRPLRDTLPESLPPTVSGISSAPEVELVSIITSHGLFMVQTEQAQDGSKLIVLSPQTPQ